MPSQRRKQPTFTDECRCGPGAPVIHKGGWMCCGECRRPLPAARVAPTYPPVPAVPVRSAAVLWLGPEGRVWHAWLPSADGRPRSQFSLLARALQAMREADRAGDGAQIAEVEEALEPGARGRDALDCGVVALIAKGWALVYALNAPPFAILERA